jgi:endonuclease G, mitochondrial
MTVKNIFLFFVFILSISCKSDDGMQPNETIGFEPKSNGEIIKHTYYSLSYSEDNEQAYWVYYELTPELINGNQSRTDDFRADPLVSTGSASLEDYKGSGYDRGHLCPAADMTLNKTSMSETFYLSNMSPQIAGFNRGIWSTMEDQVRKWALKYNKLYVVTGPIFKDNIGAIGEDKVTVPGYYYKVLFDGNNRMIGLILPNASSSKSLDQFVVTIDEIEKQTGIDFFPGLDDQLENQLEKSVDTSNWSF